MSTTTTRPPKETNNRHWSHKTAGGAATAVGVRGNTYEYDVGRVLGCGSFGSVLAAHCVETRQLVAIKAVFQDPRFKNRELEVMRQISHPNVVGLLDYFYTDSSRRSAGEQTPQRYLHLVMEFLPDTIYRTLKIYSRNNCFMPIPLVQVYVYQMLRALGFIHSLGICHRDIKPQNLLINSKTHVLKLCDFGSAKCLHPSEQSVSYICTRFYRAPELMLGATEYTCAIDLWSLGCVMAELITGKPLFAGETSVDQILKIFQVLGSPTRPQMKAMNRQYAQFPFPKKPEPQPLDVVLKTLAGGRNDIPPSAIDLLNGLLKFVPNERIAPYEALGHPFFDALRDPNLRLPPYGSRPPSDLFAFTEYELSLMSTSTRARVAGGR